MDTTTSHRVWTQWDQHWMRKQLSVSPSVASVTLSWHAMFEISFLHSLWKNHLYYGICHDGRTLFSHAKIKIKTQTPNKISGEQGEAPLKPDESASIFTQTLKQASRNVFTHTSWPASLTFIQRYFSPRHKPSWRQRKPSWTHPILRKEKTSNSVELLAFLYKKFNLCRLFQDRFKNVPVWAPIKLNPS